MLYLYPKSHFRRLESVKYFSERQNALYNGGMDNLLNELLAEIVKEAQRQAAASAALAALLDDYAERLGDQAQITEPPK